MSVLGGNPSMDYCKELRAELAELREDHTDLVMENQGLKEECARLREQFAHVVSLRGVAGDGIYLVKAHLKQSEAELARLREQLDTRTAMLQANDDKWANAVAELARLREALEQVFREEGLTRENYPEIWELMGW